MEEKDKMHVVMLPWLAFGHMIPYLELSIALAKHGVHVSFLSTPRNIERLPKIPPNLSKFIDFVSFPLPNPPSDPLPENAEATVDIPADKMESLKRACDLLHHPIKNFVAEKLPNCIIVDFFYHWAADIAQEFSIPLIQYSPVTTSTASFFWSPECLAGDGSTDTPPRDLTRPPDWVDFPSKVAFKNHEVVAMNRGFHRTHSLGISDGGRLMKLVQVSRAIVVRTCPEIEGDYLKAYSIITGKPILPLGLLLPEIQKTTKHESWTRVFDWLDQQKPRSVVFVGFGSETNLSREQIHEIAYGLELSGIPFLWALRKPQEINDDDDVLPPGFCSRTAEQGVVELGWAPQREILGHPSVGGSFFHAGWGSIIEAMQFGHVLVFLPFIFDQPLNARLMGERDLGIEVERAEDGSFSRDSVADALREAMLSEQLRARAERATSEIFGNHDLQSSYIEKFVEFLKNCAQK